MKTLDYIHLDAVAAGKVVEALQQLLADYQVFYTWNTGKHKGKWILCLMGVFFSVYLYRTILK